jgi:hypothetical protein
MARECAVFLKCFLVVCFTFDQEISNRHIGTGLTQGKRNRPPKTT